VRNSSATSTFFRSASREVHDQEQGFTVIRTIWINSGGVVSAQNVAAIKARRTLVYGVSEGIAGFSIESHGS
jgi:hypothetical protein